MKTPFKPRTIGCLKPHIESTTQRRALQHEAKELTKLSHVEPFHVLSHQIVMDFFSPSRHQTIVQIVDLWAELFSSPSAPPKQRIRIPPHGAVSAAARHNGFADVFSPLFVVFSHHRLNLQPAPPLREEQRQGRRVTTGLTGPSLSPCEHRQMRHS